jgi:hypothetical protein
MRGPKKFLVPVIFLLTCNSGSLTESSFESAYAMEQNACTLASEYILELLEIEEMAFQGQAECLPMFADPNCKPGKIAKLVDQAEALRKKIIETAHRCLGKETDRETIGTN